MESIQVMLVVLTIENFEVQSQMNVKIFSLNGDLLEEIYIQQPKGFVVKSLIFL
jgi:hypothetical protein